MKVMLVFDWDSTIEPERMPDSFFKIVDVPSLPHVGTKMLFMGGDDGGFLFEEPSVVTSVEWVEDHPEWYEVHFQELLEMTVAEASEFMTNAGWSDADWPDGYQ